MLEILIASLVTSVSTALGFWAGWRTHAAKITIEAAQAPALRLPIVLTEAEAAHRVWDVVADGEPLTEGGGR